MLVRLSHSHVRFGTFQRCAYLDDRAAMAKLVDYCVAEFHPEADDPDMSRKACALLEQIAVATGKMIGQWMAAGFVHGVMNTDNFNITGETFDFGPWRFMAQSDPNFTAAYFDQNGLYRFGRQPVQGGWALQQLASALLLLAEAEDLAPALAPYEAAYRDSFAAHTHALLGLAPLGRPRAGHRPPAGLLWLDDRERRRLATDLLRLVRRPRQRADAPPPRRRRPSMPIRPSSLSAPP